MVRVIASYQDDRNIVCPSVFEVESIEEATGLAELLSDAYADVDLTIKLEIPKNQKER